MIKFVSFFATSSNGRSVGLLYASVGNSHKRRRRERLHTRLAASLFLSYKTNEFKIYYYI